MTTAFSDLGLDPEQVETYLKALGVDVSGYDAAELESLALVANLMILQAITDKSTEIEQNLASYQIEVDKTSSMQQTLNNLREYISTEDATADDLMTFVTTDIELFAIEDTSSVILDVSFEFIGFTFAFDNVTLDDYLTALANDGDINVTMTDSSGTVYYDTMTAIEVGWYLMQLDGETVIFSGGNLTFNRDAITHDDVTATVDHYDFELEESSLIEYSIARVLQASGYLPESVILDPVAYADEMYVIKLENLDARYFGSDIWIETSQLYNGKVTLNYDIDARTLTLSLNGTAALSGMGIDFVEYFQSDTNTYQSNWPEGVLPDDTSGYLDYLAYYIHYYLGYDSSGAEWSDYSGKSIEGRSLESDDIDTLLQAAATSIESQSTQTEVALLTVNSGITEWGELNDVWDLVHEYVHDSLKRASDNFL